MIDSRLLQTGPNSLGRAAFGTHGLRRYAGWDALLMTLALAHGGLLLAWPSIALIAVGLWWNANTISHQFIHRPLFRSRTLSVLFSVYLSVLLGFPQSLWRAGHLRHHNSPVKRDSLSQAIDFGAAILLWTSLVVLSAEFTLRVYFPGFLIGLGLCFLQGHYEHAAGTTSHYGKLYNFLFFNDGYHTEHHARPGVHWRELPGRTIADARTSRWPPVLRWLDCANLCSLERLVLWFEFLQTFVIRRHEQAFRKLLDQLSAKDRIGIVGGGLYPRTVLVLHGLLPASRLTVIDLSADNLEVARRF